MGALPPAEVVMVDGERRLAYDTDTVGAALGKAPSTVREWCRNSRTGTGRHPDIVAWEPLGQINHSKQWLISVDWLRERFPEQFKEAASADGAVQSLRQRLADAEAKADFYKGYAPPELTVEEQLAKALATIEERDSEIERLRAALDRSEDKASKLFALASDSHDEATELRARLDAAQDRLRS